MRLVTFKFILTAGAVLIASYGLLALLASKSLYYPIQYPAGDWDAGTRLGAQDVELRASDGTRLHAWWISRPGARIATLHLHGNGGNITHRSYAAQTILAAGSSILLVDYRGYGKSAGRPSEKGLYRDAAAGYEWLLSKGYTPAAIVIHGESLGTAVAADLASNRPCAGVILEAPFSSARAVAARVLPWIGPALISGFDTKRNVKKLKAPLLVIHGTDDEVIPYELGKEVYEAAPDPKHLWTLQGATHNDLHYVGKAEFSTRLADFYASLN
ncbi:MAG TPA: alpha/beta hydrolase [Bryobacteraceae bacterium]|nr:alpha/beta hydrolase [Bryobacteraceae bacterium]